MRASQRPRLPEPCQTRPSLDLCCASPKPATDTERQYATLYIAISRATCENDDNNGTIFNCPPLWALRCVRTALQIRPLAMFCVVAVHLSSVFEMGWRSPFYYQSSEPYASTCAAAQHVNMRFIFSPPLKCSRYTHKFSLYIYIYYIKRRDSAHMLFFFYFSQIYCTTLAECKRSGDAPRTTHCCYRPTTRHTRVCPLYGTRRCYWYHRFTNICIHMASLSLLASLRCYCRVGFVAMQLNVCCYIGPMNVCSALGAEAQAGWHERSTVEMKTCVFLSLQLIGRLSQSVYWRRIDWFMFIPRCSWWRIFVSKRLGAFAGQIE